MKRLHYFGTRISFIETLNEELHGLIESKQLQIHHKSIRDLDDYTFNEHEDISVIILDISPLDEILAPKICPSLLMLKEEEQLNKTKVLLTCAKKPSLELEGLYHSCGVQSYHIWGGDEKLFLRNILEFLDQNPSDSSEFATLNQISTTIPCYFPATFNKISSKIASIESPTELPLNKKLIIQGGLINELGLKNITLKAAVEDRENLYYPNKYVFIPPIVQDISHVTKNDLYGEKISKLHFEKILKTHGKNFIHKINSMGVFGPNRKMKRISKLLNLESCSEVHWFSHLQGNEEILAQELPDLIFLNVEAVEEVSEKCTEKNGFKYEDIPKLIQIVQKQDFYEPIIIILNSPSHSNALKQVFRYEKLMAFQQSMTREVLIGIIQKYNEWYDIPFSLNSPQFIKVESQDRVFWIEDELILETLNEDFVEFYYNGDIPAYTWVRVECPESLTLLVLHEIVNKSGPNKEKAYKARIMGLQGMLESYVRVFINHCIDNPNESFQNFKQIKERVYKSLEEVEGHIGPSYNKEKVS